MQLRVEIEIDRPFLNGVFMDRKSFHNLWVQLKYDIFLSSVSLMDVGC
jgi:hypothetical protein